MPLPIDPRSRPADVQVHVSTGAGVDIRWADGHSSHYDFHYLREECPCATCNDEREKKASAPHALAPAASGPSAAPAAFAPLPMFKPRAKAQSARAVGNYALQIDFTDGHSTGIYSFEHLRAICPCPECAARRS